ncbi:MAG: hypothetical protein M0R47_04740 [Methylobacter sp.]|jgi:hypothetical protein|uniref:hypothetical protein n=1 Tax=Methylobacter sp. TaxID=2051955 RepID=UPI0025D59A1E|nr:hypothetical protein [Methylobacter sp.]MCK9619825.1 hypothetical protein [Methylobacter sp.]
MDTFDKKVKICVLAIFASGLATPVFADSRGDAKNNTEIKLVVDDDISVYDYHSGYTDTNTFYRLIKQNDKTTSESKNSPNDSTKQ